MAAVQAAGPEPMMTTFSRMPTPPAKLTTLDNYCRHGAQPRAIGRREFQRRFAAARSAHQLTAAMSAAPGMVKIQAQTTRPATPQRTALTRLREPTPKMPPVIVCVVLIGMPPMLVVVARVI